MKSIVNLEVFLILLFCGQTIQDNDFVKYFAKQGSISLNFGRQYSIVELNCNEINCKKEYGTCIDKKCHCNLGYVHNPLVNSKKNICQYRQYNWIKVLILELMIPGLGILYFRCYFLGFMKLTLIPIVYYKWGDSKGLELFFYNIFGFFLIFYHIKDLSLLMSNSLIDRNGVYPI